MPPETTADRALRIALQARAEIGHPPVAAMKDPGSGLWMVLDDVRTTCMTILARLDAADALATKREGWAGKVGWEVARLLIAALVVWGLAALSGHWHW